MLLRFTPAALGGLLLGWAVSGWIVPFRKDTAVIAPGGAQLRPVRKVHDTPGGSRDEWNRLLAGRTLPDPIRDTDVDALLPLFPPALVEHIRKICPDESAFRAYFATFGERTKVSMARLRLEMETLRNAFSSGAEPGNLLDIPCGDGAAGAEQMLIRLASREPRFAMVSVFSLFSSGRWDEAMQEKARRTVLREVLRHDPGVALSVITESNSGSQYHRSLRLQMLMEEWSRINPAAAAAALPTLPEGGPGYLQKNYAETLLHGWHGTDPAAAAAWVESQSGTSLGESLRVLNAELSAAGPAARAEVLLAAQERGSGRLAAVFGDWLTADPSAALAKLSALPPGDAFWSGDAAAAAEGWAAGARNAGTTAEQLLDTVRSLPGAEIRDALLGGFAAYGAAQDIPLAVDAVEEMSEGAARSTAASALTEAWMRQDPPALSAWLADLPPGESRDAAVGRFAELLSRSDPPAAARWADALTADSPLRDRVSLTVRKAWEAADPKAAAAWTAARQEEAAE